MADEGFAFALSKSIKTETLQMEAAVRPRLRPLASFCNMDPSPRVANYGDGVDGAPSGVKCAKMVVVTKPI